MFALAKVGAYLKWHKGSEGNTRHKKTTNIKKITCDVNILDPLKGEIIEERTLDTETYHKFLSKNGEIYAVRAVKEGKQKTSIVEESIYKATRKAFGI